MIQRIPTKRGYSFPAVSSAMQKAIRRGDAKLAGYWALELWASGYGQYVWRRLLTVSAEDCWGILTAEVKALHDSYTEINRNIPSKTAKGRIFISKAVILLCLAKKSRDPDHLQNFVYDQQAGLDPETLTDELDQAGGQTPPEGSRHPAVHRNQTGVDRVLTPGIDPAVYFKMLMIGFFENLPSERSIASRCADSFSLRAFLGYGLEEDTPDHSSLSVIRGRLWIAILSPHHRGLLLAR
jgi:hypothetical protein